MILRPTRLLLLAGAALWLAASPASAQYGASPYGAGGGGGALGGTGGLGGIGGSGLGGGRLGGSQLPDEPGSGSVRKLPQEAEPDKPIPPPKLIEAPPDADAIAAVVNGDVITRADVENRARLFALSTGLRLTPELLGRLRPQITRELIDDRLRLQEIQHRRIVVADADVAAAIGLAEKRNNLPPGGLRQRLEGSGVAYSILIAQMRTSLGWNRVLRQTLAERGLVTESEVNEQEKIFKKQEGEPQYRVGEIFVAAEDPSHLNDARKFADIVIQQLRAGAPFGIVAAEFSQSETALKGGDLGWVRPDQLDPTVGKLVQEMPVGAVSNPVPVPGGFAVITLVEKRKVGVDLATVLNVRQAFYPFTSPLDPQAPTEQQQEALKRAQALSASAKSCGELEAANKTSGSKRASDPGPLRLDRMNAQMQTLLGALEVQKPSKALVTPDGVMVLMVCGKEQKNLAAMTREDIADQLVQERVELASRQLQQDLKRRALIDQRS